MTLRDQGVQIAHPPYITPNHSKKAVQLFLAPHSTTSPNSQKTGTREIRISHNGVTSGGRYAIVNDKLRTHTEPFLKFYRWGPQCLHVCYTKCIWWAWGHRPRVTVGGGGPGVAGVPCGVTKNRNRWLGWRTVRYGVRPQVKLRSALTHSVHRSVAIFYFHICRAGKALSYIVRIQN